MNWTWIFLRGAIAPVVALAVGLLGAQLFNRIGALDPSGASGIAQWADWAAYAGLATFLVLWGLLVWRLKRWETGHGPECQACHGPLGGVREGKRYYGRQLADFRRCYNCGKANPVPE